MGHGVAPEGVVSLLSRIRLVALVSSHAKVLKAVVFCEQAVTCCSPSDEKVSVNPRKCFRQAVKDTDELRKAVEEVQPLRVKLSLRLAQSRPLCALAWPSFTGGSPFLLTRGHACSLCTALDRQAQPAPGKAIRCAALLGPAFLSVCPLSCYVVWT